MEEDESKYRVEEPETERELTGFLRPLPEAKPTRRDKRGKSVPITKLFGIELRESTRDRIIMLILPAIAGIIDASIFAMVVTDLLPNDALYMFVLPIFAGIPIGITAPYSSKALFNGFLAVIFFAIFFLLFLASPALVNPDISIIDYLFSGGVLIAIYSLFVILATLLGVVVGVITREFF